VLVPLREAAEDTRVVLAKRAGHLRLHAGEIAFPGGKCEAQDHSVWDTALREAMEETGLPPEAAEPLGALRPLVTRSGIEVTPCVARLDPAVQLTPNPEELDLLFEVPVAFFADRQKLEFEPFEYGGRQRLVPCYQWRTHRIWGVTAAMLVMLVNAGFDAGIKLDAYWRGR
jgi:8-oxo-dGTP pyrophosphatase MutT (NUDIX family)